MLRTIAPLLVLLGCTAAPESKRSSYNCETNPKDCNGGVDEETNPNGSASSDAFKITPPTNAVAGSSTVISWEELEGAVSYDLTVATDKECKSPVFTLEKETSRTKSVVMASKGTFYICVTGNKSDGSTIASGDNGISFVVSGNVAPTFSNQSGSNLTGLSGDGSQGSPFSFSIDEDSSNGELGFQVSDQDGETVTVSSDDKPGWVTIVDTDATNKKLTFNPSASEIGTKSFSIKLTDPNGAVLQVYFSVTVTEQNDAVTDVALSSLTIDEGLGANAVVGTLSATDEDSGDSHTFTLVAGTGDTDNGSFNISGSSLRATSNLDFETKATYSVRIRGADGSTNFERAFTIGVNNINETPTDIALSATAINENVSGGSTVGTLSSTDGDSGESFTYSLVAGTGSTDNASFTISGSNLNINSSPNYEAKNSYAIRIQTEDSGSNTFQKQFTITINDLNEAPTDIALSASSIGENNAVNAVIGTLSETDPDSGQLHTFAMQAGVGGCDDADNASFNISGTSLRASASFDYETKTSYSICIRVTDNGTGSLTYDENFTITIVDDTTPPPALTSFTGATGTTFTSMTLSLDYPADVSDYNNIKIYRSNANVNPGSAAPACGSANLVSTITSFNPDPSTITVDTGSGNFYYSFRACIYDGENLVTSSNTALDVLSRNGPTMIRHFDAADIDGAGTQSGDIGARTDTSWIDKTGNNNGTLNNFPAGGSWDGDGTISDPYRLEYDGSDDSVAIGSFSSTSLSIWFRVDPSATGTNYLYHHGAINKSYAWFEDGIVEAKYHTTATHASAVSLNRWHHLAVVQDGTNINFYLDGIKFSSQTQGTESSGGYVIGSSTSQTNAFHGSISEFRSYSGTISEAEIAYLYLNSRSRYFTAPANVNIERIVTTHGGTSGGNTLSIWGWNLDSINLNSEVTIGGSNGTGINVINSGGFIKIDSPSGSLGYQNIVLNDGSNSDTATGAYLYTKTATDNLNAYFDAANIDSVGTKGTSASNIAWISLSNGLIGSLKNFAFDATSGWQGNGTTSEPYRLKFDGTDDYVTIGKNSTRSFSIWFRPDTFTTSAQYIYRNASSNPTYVLLEDGQIKMKYRTSSIYMSGYAPNKWYHVAMSNNGTNVTFYVNGSAFSSEAESIASKNEGVLGASFGGGSPFDGDIGEFRSYTDELTETEIATLYLEGRDRFVTKPANVTIERIHGGYATTTGATSFTVWGWNFDDIDLDSEVTVGGSAGSSINVTHTDGKLSINSPSGTLGGQNVVLNDGSNSDTATAAYRYTATATDNLTIYLDAANIDSIGAKGSSASNSIWQSLVDGRIAGLHNFAFDATSGWQGSGTTGDPYRLKFDGTNDFVAAGKTSAKSLSMWFRVDSGMSGVDYLFRNEAINASYAFVENGLLKVKYLYSSQKTTRIDTDTWYHYALSHDGSAVTFYLNGAAFDSHTLPQESAGGYHIGSASSGGSNLDGDIAEFRTYSDTLTTTEIETLFQEGRSRFPAANHTVFVTSTTYTGDLGGLTGADETCNSVADGASLNGAWKAILSDSSRDAVDRLHITGAIYDNAGSPSKVVDDEADLWDGTLDVAIAYYEDGTASGQQLIHSGSNSSGSAHANTCNNWIDSTSSYSSRSGTADLSNVPWISDGDYNCSISQRLYCISQ